VFRWYERAMQRLDGDWVGVGAAGDRFEETEHPYAGDLNLFGEGSLFQLVCSARTTIGELGLAKYLKEPVSLEESRLRQEAVLELREMYELRESVVAMGRFESFESRWETFIEWLELPPIEFHPMLRVGMMATVSILVLLVAAGGLKLLSWEAVARFAVPVLGIQAMVGLQFRDRISQMQSWLGSVSIEAEVLRDGLELLEKQSFQSAKLQGLVARVKGSGAAVRRLEQLLAAMSERNKDWFYVPSLVLVLGTQLMIAIETWRARNQAALPDWLAAWGEFEALQSLATYAFENSDNVMPELIAGEIALRATAIGHPLLPLESCVRNDITFDASTRLYIISGSNMSGKSTLLRAIGINSVLAFAGAPVRAASLQVSALSVCASLSIADSLLNGKSKFMSEMDRLRIMIERARAGDAVLFLVDEIMSGTNSRDRRVATEAVVKTLLQHGAIGALSTHDLALTEIATAELHGVNVHMCSKGNGDPLDFDYTLKPGVTTESNAMAIARLAGVA
jgi:ABC-type lipoprotein export system ATPase subunit